MTDHDHAHELATWGVCRVCADAGMTAASTEPDPAEQLRFDGDTFDPDADQARLGAQLFKVLAVVRDGRWRPLGAIAAEAGAPEASVSARLRDLRKPRFGGWQVERRRCTDGGTYEYRVTAS